MSSLTNWKIKLFLHCKCFMLSRRESTVMCIHSTVFILYLFSKCSNNEQYCVVFYRLLVHYISSIAVLPPWKYLITTVSNLTCIFAKGCVSQTDPATVFVFA